MTAHRIHPITSILILTSLSFMSTIGHADEETVNGFYGGLFATGSYLGNYPFANYKPEFKNYTGNPNNPYGTIYYANSTVTPNFGIGGGANLGYRYHCFRLEGEFLYNVNTTDSIKYTGAGIGDLSFGSSKTLANNNHQTYVNGQASEYMGLANVFYDLLPQDTDDLRLYPYVGVGIGYQAIQVRTRFMAKDWGGSTKQMEVWGNPGFVAPPCPVGSSCINSYDPSKVNTHATINTSSLVGQGIVGMGYEMDSFFNFYLDYRYLITPTLTYMNKSFGFSTINLGMNYSFTV